MGVLVLQSYFSGLLQPALEVYAEVGDFVLEDVGQGVGVRHNALDDFLVVDQSHLTDDWGERISEQLNNLLGGVLAVSDEHMMALPALGTAENQLLRTAVSDAYRVHSREFSIVAHHFDHSLCIRDAPISQ